MPERIGDGERGYFGCPRCSLVRTQQTLADAPAVFEVNGLRLLDDCRGEYVPRELVAKYKPWATTGLGTAELPQGGWTETWRDDAPALDLAAEVARLSGSATG